MTHRISMKRPAQLCNLLAAVALFIFGAATAQEIARIPIVDAPPGTPGLGFGKRYSAAPYKGGERGEDLIPLYLYEGRWFFAHGTSFGAHLVHDKPWSLDLVGRYRFQRLEPNDTSLQGLHEREQTIDAGFSLGIKGHWGQANLEALHDTMSVHNGEQLELGYRYPIKTDRWLFTPWISYIWQSAALSDYYFGITADEVASGRPEYYPGATRSVFYGVNTSYQLSRRFLLFLNVGSVRLDSAIEQSPLVAEKEVGVVFGGFAYMFGNTFAPPDAATVRDGLWSWRVNYGYQAAGSIVTENITGDLSKSDDVDTNIGGVTLSRLINGGRRVDFYARLAVFRHFEDEYQSNFWSYAPYVMAVGKGYVPWSDALAFRFGFGLGFSYAEQIPIQEQIKQARDNEETSHFLNYLEWTVDFPLARITNHKAVRRCFVGITDVHRSGIFATADILGNVNGGDDWITFHLECLR